jgi:hypothetical protein
LAIKHWQAVGKLLASDWQAIGYKTLASDWQAVGKRLYFEH